MKGFIEEGAWVSCTFDLAGTPKQMQKSSDRFVTYIKGDRLLTIDDKTTLACFKCKSPAKFWGGLLAFVGGLAVGAAIILSGPIGWGLVGAAVLGGTLAGVAVGCVAVAVTTVTHDCSGKQEEGIWTLEHEDTIIGGSCAILYNKSLLTCGAGGIMMASETKVAAQAVSDQMKNNARLELGVQILSQAVYGSLTGLTSGDPISAVYNGVAGAGLYAIGENNTPLGNSLGAVKVIGPDKTIGLIGASSEVAKTGASFGKAFFLGHSGFLAGSGVTFGTMAFDYFVANKYEDSLKEKNEQVLKTISRSANSSEKSIISQTH